MASTERPLSPHLSVYKWQIPMALSILHRGTGIVLAFGALLFCFWLVAIAVGESTYLQYRSHIMAWYGQLMLLACVGSFFYHLCNGIRHLFWDIGWGLEMNRAYQSAYLVIAGTIILTAVSYYFGMGM